MTGARSLGPQPARLPAPGSDARPRAEHRPFSALPAPSGAAAPSERLPHLLRDLLVEKVGESVRQEIFAPGILYAKAPRIDQESTEGKRPVIAFVGYHDPRQAVGVPIFRDPSLMFHLEPRESLRAPRQGESELRWRLREQALKERASHMSKPRISLQLWSVRDDMRRDFAATVAAVARIGYTGVELAGYGNLDAAGARSALAAAGLVVSGMHVGRQRLEEDLAGVIADAKLLHARDVICPSWPKEEFTDRAACERIGERLDGFGAKLRAQGLRFSFHNHAAEMALHEDRTVFDWMLGAAQPRNLAAEPDVYWVHVGGQPPTKFLRDHGARCPLVHLKDETELGLGPVDFPTVFAATEAVGAVEWYVVEQEKYTRTPLESVRACFEQLRTWGKV